MRRATSDASLGQRMVSARIVNSSTPNCARSSRAPFGSPISANGIASSKALGQTTSEVDNELAAELVAKTIVQRFEAVDIDQEHGKLQSGCRFACAAACARRSMNMARLGRFVRLS